MPIDGVDVERVPLRKAADMTPFGHHPAEQLVALEGLHGIDEVRPGAEQTDHCVPRSFVPILLVVGDGCRQRDERPAADRVAGVRRRGGDAEDQRLVDDRRVDVDLDLVVDDGDTGLQDRRDPPGRYRSLAPPGGPLDAPPETFAGPFDRPGSFGNAGHQNIGVGEAHCVGDRVLVLQQQDVRCLTRDSVQLAARRQQRLGRCSQIFDRSLQRCQDLGAIGGQRPTDAVVIPQTTLAVFQIRLEQRRHLAGLGPALRSDDSQLGEPARRLLAPLVKAPCTQCSNFPFAAGETAQTQDRCGGEQVRRRQGEQGLDRMSRRAELHPGIPHRVPQRFGDRTHLFGTGSLWMKQHHVDIAARAQQAVRITSSRDDRPPRRQTTRQSIEPAVHLVRQPARQTPAGQIVAGDQLGARPADERTIDRLGEHRSSMSVALGERGPGTTGAPRAGHDYPSSQSADRR